MCLNPSAISTIAVSSRSPRMSRRRGGAVESSGGRGCSGSESSATPCYRCSLRRRMVFVAPDAGQSALRTGRRCRNCIRTECMRWIHSAVIAGLPFRCGSQQTVAQLTVTRSRASGRGTRASTMAPLDRRGREHRQFGGVGGRYAVGDEALVRSDRSSGRMPQRPLDHRVHPLAVLLLTGLHGDRHDRASRAEITVQQLTPYLSIRTSSRPRPLSARR